MRTEGGEGQPPTPTARGMVEFIMRRRKAQLWLLAMSLGGLLGYIALVVDSLGPRRLGYANLGSDAMAVMVGGFVGLCSAPFVVGFCWRLSLRTAIPIAYTLTLIAVVPAVNLGGVWDAIQYGFLTLVGACLGARLFMPRLIEGRRTGQCVRCGYLTRSVERCPECGHDARVVISPDRDSLGEDTWLDLLRGSRARWIAAFALLSSLVTLETWRHVRPHFTPARFKQVEAGMTTSDVRAILGTPDREIDGSPARWEYDGNSPFTFFWSVYGVSFEDGVVTQAWSSD